MVDATSGVDLLHSHTWYANLAGHIGGLLHGVPHVLTAHSLEPLRPWKEEQLGGGYRVSSWVERTAYEGAARIIAVSHGMRADVLAAYPGVDPDRVSVVHNGIDTDVYHPDADTAALTELGIDGSRPVRAVRRAGSPGRRASSTSSTPPAASTTTSSWCSARRRPTPRRSARRPRPVSTSCAPSAATPA